MGCLTSSDRARVLALITTKQEQLDDANTALTTLISELNESYKFDSNEGSQSAKKRSLEEYKKLIEWLEADINGLYRSLLCRNLVSLNVRRKHRGTYRRRY
jgi:hypothetical protein